VRVQNLRGTADKACVCGTWLRHWLNFSGQTVSFCVVEDCLGTDLVGAHVKVAGRDGTAYIVPLCKKHNQESGVLLISDAYVLVPANKAETCERSRY
jgi:hypothetical protein